MAAVAEVGSTLLSKCLDFCQALSSKGQAFNFSVAIGPDFTFSMDTRSKAVSPGIKKKASPSTLRRNARRREEYLQRKQNPSTVNSTEEVETVSDALSCDQCDYKPASEKGLRQHKRMKHKPSQPALSSESSSQATPEKIRSSCDPAPLAVSPIVEARRDEEWSADCDEIFRCACCDNMFKSQSDLTIHKMRTHPLMCIRCDLSFEDFNGVFLHTQETH